MKTRAAVVYRTNEPISVEDIEVDPPKSGEVLVKLAASGVCHSDLSVLNGTIPLPMPAVIGHEGAGTVADVGTGVVSVRPGDAVMLTLVTPCGRCFYCVTGRPNLCATHWRTTPRATLGDGTCRFHKGDQRLFQMARLGTMSEYAVVSENAVIRVEADTPLDKAALIGCGVMTGVGAVVHTAKVEVGSSVVVIGAGGVGLNVVQGAVLAGAGQIIVADILTSKLEFARSFGATHTIDASKEDAVARVMELTDNEGADYAFEVIGNPKTIADAFRMIRPGGAAIVVGIARRDAMISIPAATLAYGERRLIGCMYGSARMRVDMPRLLHLYREGKLKLDELVTRTYPLDQVNDAFADLEAGRNIRGVIRFDG